MNRRNIFKYLGAAIAVAIIPVTILANQRRFKVLYVTNIIKPDVGAQSWYEARIICADGYTLHCSTDIDSEHDNGHAIARRMQERGLLEYEKEHGLARDASDLIDRAHHHSKNRLTEWVSY